MNLENTKPVFIYANTVHNKSVNEYPGLKMWLKMDVDFTVEQVCHELNIDTPKFIVGGSVANLALSFAHWLNPSVILFLGQDLAYTNKKKYASKNIHFNNEENRVTTENGLIKVKDIFNEDIYTTVQFITYKNWFEDYIEVYGQGLKIFNCTEGGLEIKGIPNMAFKVAIDQFCNNEDNIYERLTKVARLQTEVDEKELDKYFDDRKKEIEELHSLSSERINMIAELEVDYLNKSFDNKIDNALQISMVMENIIAYQHFIRPVGKRYIDAVSTSTHNSIDKEENINEKRRLILNGLKKQYEYVHLIIENILSLLKEEVL